MNDEEQLKALVSIIAEYGMTEESLRMIAQLKRRNSTREEYLEFVKNFLSHIAPD